MLSWSGAKRILLTVARQTRNGHEVQAYARRDVLQAIAAAPVLPSVWNPLGLELNMTGNDLPRIPPIADEDITEAARDFFAFVDGPGGRAAGSKLNVIRTLAHNPELGQRYFQFGVYVLRFSTLPPRIRELVTLRTATLYDSDYEWTKHVVAARKAGMSDAEIEAVRTGPQAPVWTELERALLTATDQMIRDNGIEDGVWQVIAGQLDYRQQLDYVFTVSSYAMLAMALNALNVQLEPE